jgi:hypothetical protein
MKNIFYIIYNYDIKELPHMLCNTLDEVSSELNYSKRMIQHGLNKGLVFTKDDGTRYTVAKFNMKDLENDGL